MTQYPVLIERLLRPPSVLPVDGRLRVLGRFLRIAEWMNPDDGMGKMLGWMEHYTHVGLLERDKEEFYISGR